MIDGTTNVTLGALGGLLLFGQTVGNWWFYGIGFVLGIIGVLLLSRYQSGASPSPQNHPSNETPTPAELSETQEELTP